SGLLVDYTLTGTSTRPNKGNNNNTLTGYGQAGIVIPRSLMKYEDMDWTPPELWDPGISGLLVDYTLTGTSTRPNKGNNNNTLTGYGQAGINLGEWRLRAEYQGNYSSEYSSIIALIGIRFTPINHYLTKPQN
ncbi:FimD/PapC N-terminal domain-containing protein, partial [Shigella sp. FC1967]|uniref:FimD/PapC N-terminal domain-containing protein n=1 Tax=Shigella sp. FC1967 TaxID=1898041 RepID=UPI000AFC8E22